MQTANKEKRFQLISVRNSRGWNIQQAVDNLKKETGIGISVTHLYLVENKERDPSVKLLKALSNFYNISCDAILE